MPRKKDPVAEAFRLASKLCQRSPDAMAAVKKLYQKAWHHNDGALLRTETLLQIRVLLGHNRAIAVKRAKGDQEAMFQRSRI